MRSSAWVPLALLAVGVLALQGTASHPSGPRAIVLHVSITNESVSLNGSESEQSISLAGEVKVDLVGFVTLRVALTASTDLSWSANLTPKEMSFTVSGTQPFNVDVFVPAKTYNRTAVLTVRGDATISGLPADTSSDTADINVNGPGSEPSVPVLPPPKGKAPSVQVPNLPVIVGLVAAAAVIATAATFWLWKARRVRRDSKDRKPERKRAGRTE